MTGRFIARDFNAIIIELCVMADVVSLVICKGHHNKSLKMPLGVIRSRKWKTDNIIAKRNTDNRTNYIKETLQRKLKIEQRKRY